MNGYTHDWQNHLISTVGDPQISLSLLSHESDLALGISRVSCKAEEVRVSQFPFQTTSIKKGYLRDRETAVVGKVFAIWS